MHFIADRQNTCFGLFKLYKAALIRLVVEFEIYIKLLVIKYDDTFEGIVIFTI